MEINKEDIIELEFYFSSEFFENYETEAVKEGEEINMVEDWNYQVSDILSTNALDLGIKDEINCDNLVSILLNNCEHDWDDDDNPSFKYPVFGEWVLQHYKDSMDYFIDDDTSSERLFIADDNASLRVKLFDKDGNIKYKLTNAFDNINQDEPLASYLDDFID